MHYLANAEDGFDDTIKEEGFKVEERSSMEDNFIVVRHPIAVSVIMYLNR